MSNWHGSVISYKDIDTKSPKRRDFINQEEYDDINTILRNREKLLFLPTYVEEQSFQDVKYGKASYKIVLMGILKDGRKMSVLLDGIEPYFEIQVPDDVKDDFINNVKNVLKQKKITPCRISSFYAKQFKYYQEKPTLFYRFYFTKNSERLQALKLINENPSYANKEGEIKYFSTTHDDIDKNCYHRVVCRDFDITLSSWSTLENYEILSSHMRIKGEVIKLHITNYKKLNVEGGLPIELLKDKTLSACWDIETYSPDGKVPDPEIPTHRIFCLSLTFQWVNNKDAFYKVALCDYPAKPHNDFQTIICENETNILLTFAKLIEKFKPEFIFGFNDSDYDWKWVIRRASKTPGLLIRLCNTMTLINPYPQYTDEVIEKYIWSKKQVKIDASTSINCRALHLPGFIPVDVRMLFRKLYPTSKYSSLKFFLEENKLDSKEDMPIHKLFSIYTSCKEYYDNIEEANKLTTDSTEINNNTKYNIEEANKLATELTEINNYCVIDSLRCHDLLLVRSLILNARELSNLAYVSLFDSFYKANGMKIRNLTISIGQTAPFSMRFSNIQRNLSEGSKFQGAFVFPPQKGLNTSKLSINERIKKAKLIYNEITNSILSISDKSNDNNLQRDKSNDNNLQRENSQSENLLEKNIIEEKLNTTPYEKSYYDWLLITDKEKEKMYNFIKTYGPSLSYEDIEIIKNSNKPPKQEKNSNVTTSNKFDANLFDILNHECFIEFLTENTSRPIAGLDFSSLYPSIIRCYNFSPEFCIVNKDLAKKLHNEGHKLTRVEFSYENRKRLAWFIWHNNKINLYKQDEQGNKIMDPEFKFGIYPYILEQLFNKRAELKKEEKKYERRKNELESLFASEKYIKYEQQRQIGEFNIIEIVEDHNNENKDNEKNNNEKNNNDKDNEVENNKVNIEDKNNKTDLDNYKLLKKEYDDVCYFMNVAKTKQLAVKVFMNTFYGETGNRTSPFFILEVARGITLYGERSIKLAHQTVVEKNCTVYYGDTDSIYLSVNEDAFAECDIDYYTDKISKEKYWNLLVELSFKEIVLIRNLVNSVFEKDNGTKFLTMAFEEFLFPSGFTAKKKYFGIPHVEEPIFGLRNMFIKGLDIVKRGVSKFLIKICSDLMYECMDIKNLFTILELIKMKIKEVYNTTWKLEDFIQSASYKPDKKNVRVNLFVDRMKELGIVIKPSERFDYVIVKKYPFYYDTHGRKKKIKIGDKMEFIEEVKNKKHEIDIDYYMDRSVNGQLARLLSYHPMLSDGIDVINEDDDDELVELEKKIYDNACKYVKDICTNYYKKYNTFGKTFKNIYKKTMESFKKNIDDELTFKLLNMNVNFEKFDEKIVSQIFATAESEAVKMCKNYGKNYIESKLDDKIKNIKNKYLTSLGETTEVGKKLTDEEKKEKKNKEKELNKFINKKRINLINHYQKVYFGKIVVGGSPISNIVTIKSNIFEKNKSLLLYRTSEIINKLYDLYNYYDGKISDLSNIIRDRLDLTPFIEAKEEVQDYDLEELNVLMCKDEELDKKAKECYNNIMNNKEVDDIMKEYKKIYFDIFSEYVIINRVNSIETYLRELKEKNNQLILIGKKEKEKIFSEFKVEKQSFKHNF